MYQLASEYANQGQVGIAEAAYRQAISINPGFAEACTNLGNLLTASSRCEEALRFFNQAIAASPTLLQAWIGKAIALHHTMQLDEAMQANRQALLISNACPIAHNNLGNVLRDMGRFDLAEQSYRSAIAIQPDYATAYSNLLLAETQLMKSTPEALLEEARGYDRMIRAQASPYESWKSLPRSGEPLRVGLVSADFHGHPVGYFLDGILSELAKHKRIKIFLYSNRQYADDVTKRLQANCHKWLQVHGLSDKALAQQIHDDAIHILVDLSGHTGFNRLPVFAWRPAPLQLTWLGYFGTTGLSSIDYLLADELTLPISMESGFTERIWRMPTTRLCFTAPHYDLPVGPLPALRNGYITFGCFNDLAKINTSVISLWAQVMTLVPNSRLMLKSRHFAHSALVSETLNRFSYQGIDPNRIACHEYSSREDYLRAYSQVDIALDPFPYPGGTTTAEALWMGIPVLTMTGTCFLARQGVGLLTNAGLVDWIADGPDDYIQKSAKHATDLVCLSQLRARLRKQVLESPIFNSRQFALDFEAALWGMCHQRRLVLID